MTSLLIKLMNRLCKLTHKTQSTNTNAPIIIIFFLKRKKKRTHGFKKYISTTSAPPQLKDTVKGRRDEKGGGGQQTAVHCVRLALLSCVVPLHTCLHLLVECLGTFQLFQGGSYDCVKFFGALIEILYTEKEWAIINKQQRDEHNQCQQ